MGFHYGSMGKEYNYNSETTGEAGSIPGLGRSPGGGNSHPFYYSSLENYMDRGAWWATVPGTEHAHSTIRRILVLPSIRVSLISPFRIVVKS